MKSFANFGKRQVEGGTDNDTSIDNNAAVLNEKFRDSLHSEHLMTPMHYLNVTDCHFLNPFCVIACSSLAFAVIRLRKACKAIPREQVTVGIKINGF